MTDRVASLGGVLFLSVVVAVMVALIGVGGGEVEAQSSETVTAEFAGESMNWSPPGAAQVVSDSSAQGGRALAMLTNSTASKSVTTTQAVDKVVVRMRGKSCDGYAQAILKVDGTTVGTKDITNDASGGPYADYTYNLPSNLAAGSHEVGIDFANDLYQSSSCDRNLLVDHVTLQAAATPNSFAAESMSGVGEPSTKIVDNAQANDGKAVAYLVNDTLSKSVTTSEQIDSVVLRQRGKSCDGYARSTLKIDGTTVGAKDVTNDTSGGPYADYTYTLSSPLAAGTHTIEVQYANDYYQALGCDRNLVLDHVTLQGPSSPPPSGISFSDTFDRGADTFRPPWDDINQAESDRITTDSSVVRKGTHSAKYTVYDGDVAPLTHSENPRAQLNENAIFCDGDNEYIGSSVYFPRDFPVMPLYGWLVVNSFGFAPPYGSTVDGAGGLQVTHPGDDLELERGSDGARLWTTSIERERWIDIVVHIKFSTDPSVGYVELWKNGVKQTLSDGSERMYYQTFDPDATDCGNLQPTNYRKKGMFSTVTIYQDELKVGSTYSAVAP